MVADTLRDILETEKSIQEMLKEERAKASLWVEEQKQLIAAETKKQLQSLEDAHCLEKEKIAGDTEQLTKQLLEKNQQRNRFIEEIPDQTLLTIIRKHLQKILPETR